MLQGMFRVDYATAKAAFVDLVMYSTMKVFIPYPVSIIFVDFKNPVRTLPVVWNDDQATVQQKTSLLLAIRRSQGPGLTHLMEALRTPQGRPVSRTRRLFIY